MHPVEIWKFLTISRIGSLRPPKIRFDKRRSGAKKVPQEGDGVVVLRPGHVVAKVMGPVSSTCVLIGAPCRISYLVKVLTTRSAPSSLKK